MAMKSPDELRRLMALQTGDEKHDQASYDTLDVLWVLYERILRFDPADPAWEARDRFILSKAHGPTALYAILASLGFFDEALLPGFIEPGNPLGSHPDRLLVPGIEASTGSLGHGLPMAAGVALALRAKGLTEQRVVVLCGDAEMNEGSNWEALLLAADQRLTNLTLVIVDNHSSSIAMPSWGEALNALAWSAVTVDGHDHAGLERAFTRTADGGPSAVVADVSGGVA